jgi:uncharacterized membrane protein HdeD (DUF308 family)
MLALKHGVKAMHTRQGDFFTFLSAHGLQAITRNWWLVLLRGIVSILFGIAAFTWPGITVLALALLFGAYALADGVLALIAAVSGSERSTPAWWLALVGVLGIAAGITAFLWPGITAFALVLVIGSWALLIGIFEIVGAIRLRHEIDNEWWLIAAGILSVLFGLAVLLSPGAGALAIVWVIAAYAIIAGALMIAFSFRLRSHHVTHGGDHGP